MLIAALLACLIQGPPGAPRSPVVLGVLETPQVEGGPDVAARLCFIRRKGKWQRMSVKEAQEAPVSGWTVGHRGVTLGRVDLGGPKAPIPMDARDGLLRTLKAPDGAPQVTEGKAAFGGWMRGADRRPLVIQRTGPAPDPEGWVPRPAPETLRPQLWKALRRAWGRWTPVHCPQDVEKAIPLRVGAGDLVFQQAFQARDGRWIVAVGLDPDRHRCDGVMDPEWSSHWFLVGEGRFSFLGRELAWVEAGDFAGTGHSDILFAHAGYNADGYVLWSEGLTRKTTLTWSYH